MQGVFYHLECKKGGLVALRPALLKNEPTIKQYFCLQVVSLQTENGYGFSFKSRKSLITDTNSCPSPTRNVNPTNTSVTAVIVNNSLSPFLRFELERQEL